VREVAVIGQPSPVAVRMLLESVLYSMLEQQEIDVPQYRQDEEPENDRVLKGFGTS
jgi:hypothetical protein